MSVTIDLSGSWEFELDPADAGMEESWFQRSLSGQVRLPGFIQEQGYGDPISPETPWVGDIVDRSYFEDERYAVYRQPGNIKVPFWLQPDRYYKGAAWFRTTFDVPQEWHGRRLTLFLERPHWETRLWLDGGDVGLDRSLSTPHVYELGTQVEPGRHSLVMRIDNRMVVNVGPNAHSISDHTQGNWNGVVGRLELRAGSPLWIAEMQVYPDLAACAARVHLRLGNLAGFRGAARISLRASAFNDFRAHAPAEQSFDLVVDSDRPEYDLNYVMGDRILPWDEFHPALYHLEAVLQAGEYAVRGETVFGMREVGVNGTRITLNGRPIFIRGTLECASFPRTGTPPVDVDSWKRIIRVCKAHGLNQLRFHSWCPPEAAFIAADELGFYFQIECASWANQGASIGLGDPLDDWLYAEGRRIVAAYGNHPSFLMMAYGNEPGGAIVEYLTKWVSYWKQQDPRRLHTSAAGWPMLEENDYHNVPQPRIHAWGAGLSSRINALPPETLTDYRAFVAEAGKPVVSHEIGQWCAYPNFAEIDKYARGWLKGKNFEIFRDSLQANGMGDQARAFLMASGKLQVLCYKEEIESALRTPGFAGFHLLDLHDFPGQGTALVGVLDPFYEPKGYIHAEEYRRFCNAIVPLARLKKRVFTTAETFEADVEIAQFGPVALKDAASEWKLETAGGDLLAQGRFPARDLPVDNCLDLGHVSVPLHAVPVPGKLRFTVRLTGTRYENDWEVWVYPENIAPHPPAGVHLAAGLDAAAQAVLSSGGTVLLMPPAGRLVSPVVLGFSSIFWNTAWTRNQPPHTLGILCDPKHPLFAAFPTEYHTNWQWWEPLQLATALVLDDLPGELRPLIQPIDTWFENRRLGLLFEARVHGGKLVVCSMDLRCDSEDRVAARQLLHSLYAYLGGPAFAPTVELSLAQVQTLLARHS